MNDLADQNLMTAAEPAAERITLALVESVKAVSRNTGYWTDVVVYRPNPGGPPPIVHAGIEVSVNTEAKEPAPLNIEQIRVSHYFTCDVISPESNPVSIDTLLHRIKADVKKAIRADPFLGGLAMDTVMGDAVVLDADAGAHAGRIVVEAQTIYRTLEDDPYQILSNPPE
jgi:hypothetical protein